MTLLWWLRPIVIVLCLVPVIVTALGFTQRTHWLFRLWDFPRVQIAVLSAVGGGAYVLFFFENRLFDLLLMGALAAVVVYQLYRIHTYTRLVRPTVLPATEEMPSSRIVLLVTNVMMENNDHGRLLETIRQSDPDVILAVEVDPVWNKALEPLVSDYRHAARQIQNNYYGMLLLSRLELVDPRVDFLVQDDVPSIHAGVRLRSGTVITLHSLHPRPPEPVRDQPSSPRDAELVVLGRAIGRRKGEVPTIVAGDLNDVAWSATSQLFVRLSGLLDPRAGRGFFNTYNAKNPLFRYPLDHVFHSVHFELVRLERLPAIGSDHFPILIELQYSPEAARRQAPSDTKPGDEALADDKLAQQSRDAQTGADRPSGE